MRLGGGDIDVGNSYIVQIAVTDVERERGRERAYTSNLRQFWSEEWT